MIETLLSIPLSLWKELRPLIEIEVSKLKNSILNGVGIQQDNWFQIIYPLIHRMWVSNLVPIQNKNGYIHLCVDHYDLNKASLKGYYPLTSMEQILQTIGIQPTLDSRRKLAQNNVHH